MLRRYREYSKETLNYAHSLKLSPLFYALFGPQRNHLAAMHYLKIYQAYNLAVDVKDWHGNTVAHYAVLNGDLEFISLLLEVDPKIALVTNRYGQTPLMLVAGARLSKEVASNRLNLFVLLAKNSDFAQCDILGKNIWDYLNANKKLCLQIFASLVEHENCIFIIEKLASLGYPIAHKAMRNNREAAVRCIGILGELQVSLVAPDQFGNTIAHYAALMSNAMALLALKNLDPAIEYVVNHAGQTPLMLAMRRRVATVDVFAVLSEVNLSIVDLEHKNIIDYLKVDKNFFLELFGSIDKNDNCAVVIRKLTELGFLIVHKALDYSEDAAVHCIGMVHEIRDVLIAKDAAGNTIAHYAALFGYAQVLKLLKKFDFRIEHVCNNDGQTPVMFALANKKITLDVFAVLGETNDKIVDVHGKNIVMYMQENAAFSDELSRLRAELFNKFHCRHSCGHPYTPARDRGRARSSSDSVAASPLSAARSVASTISSLDEVSGEVSDTKVDKGTELKELENIVVDGVVIYAVVGGTARNKICS